MTRQVRSADFVSSNTTLLEKLHAELHHRRITAVCIRL
jgi:hypothetical protein